MHEDALPGRELDRAEAAVPQIVEHPRGRRDVVRVKFALAPAQMVQRHAPEAEVCQHDEEVDHLDWGARLSRQSNLLDLRKSDCQKSCGGWH